MEDCGIKDAQSHNAPGIGLEPKRLRIVRTDYMKIVPINLGPPTLGSFDTQQLLSGSMSNALRVPLGVSLNWYQ
eukprot:1601364-Amphidinium_carterae.1